MSTLKDMVAEARRLTYGTMTEQINVFAQAADPGATTLTMQLDVAGISQGHVISSGLNVWYVIGSTPNTNEVFVIPGYDNAPSTEVNVGDIVYVRPKVTDWYLFNMINDEIRRLSSPTNGLYRLDSWIAQVSPTYQTYEVPEEARDMTNILRVRYRWPGTPDVWSNIKKSLYQWQVTATDNRVQLLTNIPSGTDIEFVYSAPFAEATSLDDDPVADCGLAHTMLDLPALGAAATLLRSTDGRRNQPLVQSDPRRASEVQPGANLSTAQVMDREYKMRVQDEYARLLQRYSIYMGI